MTTIPAVRFVPPGQAWHTLFDWRRYDAVITGDGGRLVYEQRGVEFPVGWDQNSVNIVAQKYFWGDADKGEREWSLRQLVDRVVGRIADWAARSKVLPACGLDEASFVNELGYLIASQRFSFNSPVLFNVGVDEQPQTSACFILSVKDTMTSIAENVMTEMMIFKHGSGAGSNRGSLRSKREKVRGGGRASGPMSFIRVYDAAAGGIKSGGKTRRAAKMEILDVDHLDVREFVTFKRDEERKAKLLVAAGVDGSFCGEAYSTVSGQNANYSVRVTDEFMRAVEAGGRFTLRGRKQVELTEEIDARDLWRLIAQCAHDCADPGVQFDGEIQRMHTCANDGPIRATNPCCFPGDTLIDTAEGRLRMDELHRLDQLGKPLPLTVAFDRRTRMPVLRQIKKVWIAGQTSHLVEVATDKGIRVRCTPEHRFLLHDGSYVEAQDLTPGTRLRKIARAVNHNRSERRMLQHRVLPNRPNGCTPQAVWMWEQTYGPVPTGMDVHHLNDDPTDDRLSNLGLVEFRKHQSEHSSGLSNPNALDIDDAALVETWEAIEAVPRRTPMPVTPSRWNKYVRDHGLRGVVPLAASPSLGGRIRGLSWSEFAAWIDAKRALTNDRVSSLRRVELADPIAVYDMEVDDVHNFAVTNETDTGRHTIVVANSEYVFLDDTSCNLSSHNLLSYLDPQTKKFDVERFRYAVALSAIAMDAVIDFSSFPTPAIENGTRRYRTLGIGFTGLGALLMNLGLSYDSDAGRFLAGSITSLMTAQAYLTSAEMARHAGAFAGYAANREPFGGVLDRHATAAMRLTPPKGVAVDDEIVGASRGLWQAVQQRALSDEGFRNAQVTVLAPTGTISFLMGMQASTGVEPVLGLVTHKNLAGGGSLRQVNPWVDAALAAVGSPEDRRKRIVARIEECGSPVDPRWTLRPEERAVLLTAFADPIDGSALPWSAHVAMMASCQPFLSGAISKTVNLPETATVEDIMTVYRTAWERGLKCIAVYRDNSKGVQAVGTSAKSTASVAAALDLIRGPAWGERRKLPMTRKSVTTKFAIGPEERLSEGFLIVGLDDENQPKELFVQFNNVGGTVQGLVHGWAKAASYALQLGLPLHDLIDMALHTRFEPLGPTRNPDIPSCSSLLDFVVKWLLLQFDFPEYKRRIAGARPVRGSSRIELAAPTPAPVVEPATDAADHDDQPLRPDHDPCSACGAIMVVAGSCRVCTNCGTTTGCG